MELLVSKVIIIIVIITAKFVQIACLWHFVAPPVHSSMSSHPKYDNFNDTPSAILVDNSLLCNIVMYNNPPIKFEFIISNINY